MVPTVVAPAGMHQHTISRRGFVSAVGGGALAVSASGVAAAAGHGRTFRAHLSGDEEVPPVDTDGQGQAVFQLNRGGTELSYRLIVANVEDVVAAHVHCAPAGTNGPVGVTLFGGGPTSRPGTLAADTITAPDAGNGCGWTTLDDVVAAIRAGEAYVNVHTLANPAGELRGQLH